MGEDFVLFGIFVLLFILKNRVFVFVGFLLVVFYFIGSYVVFENLKLVFWVIMLVYLFYYFRKFVR